MWRAPLPLSREVQAVAVAVAGATRGRAGQLRRHRQCQEGLAKQLFRAVSALHLALPLLRPDALRCAFSAQDQKNLWLRPHELARLTLALCVLNFSFNCIKQMFIVNLIYGQMQNHGVSVRPRPPTNPMPRIRTHAKTQRGLCGGSGRSCRRTGGASCARPGGRSA